MSNMHNVTSFDFSNNAINLIHMCKCSIKNNTYCLCGNVHHMDLNFNKARVLYIKYNCDVKTLNTTQSRSHNGHLVIILPIHKLSQLCLRVSKSIIIMKANFSFTFNDLTSPSHISRYMRSEIIVILDKHQSYTLTQDVKLIIQTVELIVQFLLVS